MFRAIHTAARRAAQSQASLNRTSKREKEKSREYLSTMAGAAAAALTGMAMVSSAFQEAGPTMDVDDDVAKPIASGDIDALKVIQFVFSLDAVAIARTGCDYSAQSTAQFVATSEPYLSSPFSEKEEFRQCLEFYRSQLSWYKREWTVVKDDIRPISSKWPREVPSDDDVTGLAMDVKFCLRSKGGDCQDLQFRIAAHHVLSPSATAAQQYEGFRILKELAEQHEHPDAMCLYANVLDRGLPKAGLDPNPTLAVIWWKRCVERYPQHMPAWYELGVAYYTGNGVDSPQEAVRCFRRAAPLHVGAAYMLGECLLDGVGVPRRRALALEWFLVAAELGHVVARERVIKILESPLDYFDASVGDDDDDEKGDSKISASLERRFTVGGAKSLERRISIGGGSRNPNVLRRRKSFVKESREDGTG